MNTSNSNSNKSLQEAVASWEVYLKKNPNNFLKIKDVAQNRLIKGNNLKNKSFFQWVDILEKYDNLSSWFDDLVTENNLTVIVVEFKRVNGNSSRYDLIMHPTNYDVSLRLQDLKNNNAAQAPLPLVEIQNPINQPPQIAHLPTALPNPVHGSNGFETAVMQNMGGLGGAGMAAGMGFRELVTLEKKAEQSDFYKNRTDKLEKENSLLIIDNRDLLSKVSTAEREKDLAIKEAKQEAKKWSDPENLKVLFDGVSPIMASVMNGKATADPSQIGMGAAADLSKIKQNFIKYMNEDDCTDEQMKVLEDLLVLMITNEGYEEQLRTLINHTNGTA